MPYGARYSAFDTVTVSPQAHGPPLSRPFVPGAAATRKRRLTAVGMTLDWYDRAVVALIASSGLAALAALLTGG